MRLNTIGKDCRIVPILTYASGTATRTSKVIDMRGYRRCTIVVHFGTIAASAVASLKVSQANAASDSDTLTSGADLTGTSQTIAADDDNEIKYVDIIDPQERYLMLHVVKDASNAVAESACAILYYGDERPATHAEGSGTGGGADIAEGETHVAPAEGTA